MRITILSLVVLISVAFSGFAQGTAYTILGQEDPLRGWSGNLFPNTFAPDWIKVASDGEEPFMPFGLTIDVSDAIDFTTAVNAGHQWSLISGSPGWTQATSGPIWYIPETHNGIEPPTEPIGIWHSPDAWSSDFIGTFRILDPNPNEWDEIVTWNGPDGAYVSFNSDAGPGVVVPTPSAVIGGVGLLGVIGIRRVIRRKA